MLATQLERNTTARDDPYMRGSRKQFGDDRRCRNKLFEIIEHEQYMFVTYIIFDIFEQRAAAFADFQLLCNACDELIHVGIVCKRHKVHALWEMIQHFPRDLKAESRFTGATGSQKSDKANIWI